MTIIISIGSYIVTGYWMVLMFQEPWDISGVYDQDKFQRLITMSLWPIVFVFLIAYIVISTCEQAGINFYKLLKSKNIPEMINIPKRLHNWAATPYKLKRVRNYTKLLLATDNDSKKDPDQPMEMT